LIDALGGSHDPVVLAVLREIGQYALGALGEVVLHGPLERVGPAADAIATLGDQGLSIRRGELTEMRKFIYRNPLVAHCSRAAGRKTRKQRGSRAPGPGSAPGDRAHVPQRREAPPAGAGLAAAQRYLPEQQDLCGYAGCRSFAGGPMTPTITLQRADGFIANTASTRRRHCPEPPERVT
jgi:hypothetical protein